jgi:biopolymer transport protein ExbB/TolQ
MLPVLVVLFVISYSLMTMLIVEQGRTIENQRALIESLFNDSSELNHMKKQAIQKQHAEAQAQAEAQAHSQAQTTPSTQEKTPDHSGADRNNSKLRKQAPPSYPKGGDALQDVRRVVLSI